MNRFDGRQRGNALVEFALLLPLLIGIALVSTDLYNVSQARAYLEQSAHNIASVLAQQNKLDENGLQALIDQAASPDILGNYELVISKVSIDRSMTWNPLYRGSLEGLCPSYSQQRRYIGELPEEQESQDDDDEESTSTASIMVVQLCRSSNDLALTSGLLADKDLHAIAFSRMAYDAPELDEKLTEETGLEED
ncbi:TadE/TadG family type IV pilus assembly protein [Pseudomonas sp. LRF_L74]|uniref:TadE/TadG family type IV pilus assembly protein n=1 Tax=Pseudomonas sp. LRF_L74 TaxID=3369422 RepID=UPI003F60B7D2